MNISQSPRSESGQQKKDSYEFRLCECRICQEELKKKRIIEQDMESYRRDVEKAAEELHKRPARRTVSLSELSQMYPAPRRVVPDIIPVEDFEVVYTFKDLSEFEAGRITEYDLEQLLKQTPETLLCSKEYNTPNVITVLLLIARDWLREVKRRPIGISAALQISDEVRGKILQEYFETTPKSKPTNPSNFNL